MARKYQKPKISPKKIKLSYFLKNVYWLDQFSLVGDVYAQSCGCGGNCGGEGACSACAGACGCGTSVTGDSAASNSSCNTACSCNTGSTSYAGGYDVSPSGLGYNSPSVSFSNNSNTGCNCGGCSSGNDSNGGSGGHGGY